MKMLNKWQRENSSILNYAMIELIKKVSTHEQEQVCFIVCLVVNVELPDLSWNILILMQED